MVSTDIKDGKYYMRVSDVEAKENEGFFYSIEVKNGRVISKKSITRKEMIDMCAKDRK